MQATGSTDLLVAAGEASCSRCESLSHDLLVRDHERLCIRCLVVDLDRAQADVTAFRQARDRADVENRALVRRAEDAVASRREASAHAASLQVRVDDLTGKVDRLQACIGAVLFHDAPELLRKAGHEKAAEAIYHEIQLTLGEARDTLALRREVGFFAQAMERRLREHDEERGTRGWARATPNALLDDLDDACRKLELACDERWETDPSEVRDRAADVANFAMMVADVAGGLLRPAAACQDQTTRRPLEDMVVVASAGPDQVATLHANPPEGNPYVVAAAVQAVEQGAVEDLAPEPCAMGCGEPAAAPGIVCVACRDRAPAPVSEREVAS